MRDQKLETNNALKECGRAKIPPTILSEKPEWQEFLSQFLKNDPGESVKALFLDFDGTMAHFTETPEKTYAVDGFISALKIFLDKYYKVAIITGRPIKGENGILAAFKRSGADEQLLNRLDIFGSHGVEHRGPDTNWEVKVPDDIAQKIAPYTYLQQQLLSHLQQHIDNNEILKGLGISFEPKPLGATIHYRAVKASMHAKAKNELNKLLSKFFPNAANKNNFRLLEIEAYKDFTYNSATESFEIRVNPETTGVEVNKGIAVKFLAGKWKAKVAIAFGDDTTDLDMQTRLAELNLAATAFVGVKHSKTPDDIITGSTIVVEGQESSVGLLKNMAEKAEDQTTLLTT